MKSFHDVPGALSMDKYAHIIHGSPIQSNSPCLCRACGTTLRTAYHEERLYSVRCPKCDIVLLVKAGNPLEAALTIGE